MGWAPLHDDIKFRIIKFWHSIDPLPAHRLLNIVYTWSSNRIGNWADIRIENCSHTYNFMAKENYCSAYCLLLEMEAGRYEHPRLPRFKGSICLCPTKRLKIKALFTSCSHLHHETITLFQGCRVKNWQLSTQCPHWQLKDIADIYSMWKRAGCGKSCTHEGPVLK